MNLRGRVLQLFEDAGWSAAYRFAGTLSIDPDHPAHGILLRMGGLHVGIGEDGEMLESVANDIRFQPLAADSIVDQWSGLIGSPLVGIGRIHHDHAALYISGDGRVFVRSRVHDAFAFQANLLDAAITGLIVGTRSVPMLRPDQESVRWYGEVYRHGDPGLYEYRTPR